MMPPQFKLAAVAIIWVVAAILVLTMLGTGYLGNGGLFEWILAISVLGIAGGVSSSIFEEKQEKKPLVDVKVNTGKAKRGEEDFAALLELLDEDDAYELRQRIKQRLMDRIDEGGEQDVESFEQLLNNRERQKRK